MPLQIKFIEYRSAEYAELIKLRYKVLREPLGLNYSAEQLEAEAKDLFLAGFFDGNLVACCLLVRLPNDELRIRQVATEPKIQGKGFGTQLMNFVENYARQNGFYKLVLHARETAVRFYEKLNYVKVGEPFIEVGMKHWQMEKVL